MQHESSLGKKSAIALIVILALGAIYWFWLRTDPKVAALNQAIQEKRSPALRDYPYPFRVLRLEGALAVMATPRSPAMPVYRMIGAPYPPLWPEKRQTTRISSRRKRSWRKSSRKRKGSCSNSPV